MAGAQSTTAVCAESSEATKSTNGTGQSFFTFGRSKIEAATAGDQFFTAASAHSAKSAQSTSDHGQSHSSFGGASSQGTATGDQSSTGISAVTSKSTDSNIASGSTFSFGSAPVQGAVLGNHATTVKTPVESVSVSDGSGDAKKTAVGRNGNALQAAAGTRAGGLEAASAAPDAGAGLSEGGIPAEHTTGVDPAFPTSIVVCAHVISAWCCDSINTLVRVSWKCPIARSGAALLLKMLEPAC